MRANGQANGQTSVPVLTSGFSIVLDHSASALLPIHEAQKANKTSQKHARCLIFDPSKSDLASRIQCLLFASLLFPFPSLFFLHWQVISVNSKNSTSLDLMVSSFQMCQYNLFPFPPLSTFYRAVSSVSTTQPTLPPTTPTTRWRRNCGRRRVVLSAEW